MYILDGKKAILPSIFAFFAILDGRGHSNVRSRGFYTQEENPHFAVKITTPSSRVHFAPFHLCGGVSYRCNSSPKSPLPNSVFCVTLRGQNSFAALQAGMQKKVVLCGVSNAAKVSISK